MARPFLEIEGLSKGFGGLRAVNDVGFTMKRDEIVGLIGPNGAGKTTLLRLITSILKPDTGTIRFQGKNIVGLKTWDIVNLGIACTFQNMRPFRRLPIIANVMVSCLSPRAMKRGEWVKKVENKAMDALEFAGISDMALEKASTLSQGDLKRLEVARAVATEPELLLPRPPGSWACPTPRSASIIKAYVVLQSEARGKDLRRGDYRILQGESGPLQGSQDHRVHVESCPRPMWERFPRRELREEAGEE